MFPDEQIKRKMNPFIAQKTPYPLRYNALLQLWRFTLVLTPCNLWALPRSDLIYHSALCVTKDGKLFRFPSKYQICYSEHGQVALLWHCCGSWILD